MTRLGAATLGDVREADTPPYDRRVEPSIVHLGVGAFAQAHLATYADDLWRSGRPTAISGVSLRHPGAEERLGPQAGLFTVIEREAAGCAPLRVVGSIVSVATGPARAVAAIEAPATRLVTLTVTEKGCEPEPGEEEGPGAARSAPAVVAAGLRRRWVAGRDGLVVVSLDNVLDNGRVLSECVLALARSWNASFARWVEAEVRFPSSVVDRMVPATTADDRAEVSDRIGLEDRGAVVAEHHRSWVVEAVDGLPPLADVGVDVVADVGPYQRRKLWLLNGPHSAVAYAGLVLGHDTIAAAVADRRVERFVGDLVSDVLVVADGGVTGRPGGGPGTLRRFADEALRRFHNPHLGHTCVQVGADGSRKLPQRLLPVVAERTRRGLTNGRFALVAAMWLAGVTGLEAGGRRVGPLDDPRASELTRLAAGNDLAHLVSRALPEAEGSFAAEVVDALEALATAGPTVLEGDR